MMLSGCDIVESSGSNNGSSVDDLYFSALFDDDEIFPISDEKYVLELQLQEALVSSSTSFIISSRQHEYEVEVEHQEVTYEYDSKGKGIETGETSSSSHVAMDFCMICMEPKPDGEMFWSRASSHSFCIDCTSMYISAKIQEGVTNVKCPDLNCRGTLNSGTCRSVVPREVFDRWEQALCESVILGFEKVYCAYKDCSAFTVDDSSSNAQTVMSSECPSCHRLFCARCGIPWHSGLSCAEFKSSKDGVGLDEMAKALAKSKSWKMCPNCKFYVEKTSGCQHISCRCGFHFCYGCGRPWNASHCCP